MKKLEIKGKAKIANKKKADYYGLPDDIQTITLDHTEFSDKAFIKFKEALELLGIYMYEDPSYRADTYGLILSKVEISPEQLEEFEREYKKDMGFGEEED
jgi:hypothetical protein